MPDTFEDKLRQFEIYVQERYQRSISPFDEELSLHVRFQEHPIHRGWIDMVVAVNSEIAIKLLRKTEVIQWLEDRRKWLDEFQGPSNGNKEQVLNQILEMSLTKSYGEIADDVNNTIIKLLKDPVTKQQRAMLRQMSGNDLVQYLATIVGPPGGIIQAMTLMISLGFDDPDKVIEWINYALENIELGHERGFPPGKPIDRYRIANRIKEWQKRSV